MTHLDGDALALLALGEPADDVAAAHLAGCARCRHEVAELRGLVDAARWTGADPEAPSDAVWDGIRARIDDTERSTADTSPVVTPPVAPSGLPSDSSSRRSRSPRSSWSELADHSVRPGGAGGNHDRDRDRDADRPPSRRAGGLPRRRPGSRTWSFLAGAVVAALVIVAVVWGVNARTSGQVVATAHLQPIGTEATSGIAELQRASDGSSDLRLQIGADRVRGYTEVWLIAKDGKRMVSLGTLDGGSGQLPIPADLDVRDYATVDISDEPYDGNPAHSGNSILRGPLTF